MIELKFKGDYRAYFEYLYKIGQFDEKDVYGNPIFKIGHEERMLFPGLRGRQYVLYAN